MPGATPINAYPYPVLGDSPNIPADITALANRAEVVTNAQAASLAALAPALKVLGGNRYTTSATLASGITGSEALCNMSSGAIALPANSAIRVTARVQWNAIGGGTGATPDFLIHETNLAGTQVYQACIETTAANPVVGVPYMREFSAIVKTTTAVTKTYVVSAKVISGTSSMSVFGGPSNPGSVIVEYIGPSSILVDV